MEHINIHALQQKFNTKKELYNFLMLNGQAYLPKISSTNVYFLKAIVTGKKEVSFLYFNRL